MVGSDQSHCLPVLWSAGVVGTGLVWVFCLSKTQLIHRLIGDTDMAARQGSRVMNRSLLIHTSNDLILVSYTARGSYIIGLTVLLRMVIKNKEFKFLHNWLSSYVPSVEVRRWSWFNVALLLQEFGAVGLLPLRSCQLILYYLVNENGFLLLFSVNKFILFYFTRSHSRSLHHKV